jgi:branched-chain amino acid transport system ATP-binding protein
MLDLNKVIAQYGKIRVLKEISLSVNEGEIVTLIGANGAGKTTILKVISGILRPSSGTVTFLGKRLDRLSPKEIVRSGICRVPEGRHVFPRMTVLENLQLGAYLRAKPSGVSRDLEEIYEHFPILRNRRDQLAGTLSGGEQQMLAIGRGLMSKPKLLLLDEPSLGLAPLMVLEIAQIIIEIFKRGTPILLIEQNARMALNLSHRAYVLETGRVTQEGTARNLMEQEHVKQAYLGTGRKAPPAGVADGAPQPQDQGN